MGADEFVPHTKREAVGTYFMDLQCPHQGARNLTKAFLPLSITSASLCAMREVKSGSHIHERIGIGRGAEFELQQHTNWMG